jgi:cobalt transporter subunit CbtA
MTRPMTCATPPASPATEPMKHLLSGGLIAGLVAGLLCALLQWWLVEPQILLAEKYETGELVYFAGVAEAGHDHAAMDAAAVDGVATDPAATASEDHDHTHAAPEAEGPQVARHLWTVLFSILTYAGYGLLVSGVMVLAMDRGHKIGPTEALLYGLAGFLAFQGLPAVGLSPELPGVPAADLNARQLWWVATAVTAIAGLALLAYGRTPAKLVGAVLLAVPHLVGAPELEAFAGQIPPELAARFAARSLLVGLFAWMTLGFCAGRLLARPT